MKKLTKKEAIENHRKMWNWIAVETLKREEIVTKNQYFEENNIEERPFRNWYCCEYAAVRRSYDSLKAKVLLNGDDGPHSACSRCPLEWPEDSHCNFPGEPKCIGSDSPLRKWNNCNDYDFLDAVVYAKQIADLPEKESDDDPSL